MRNREYQYNRYGEKDVRPGHFQHRGGRGTLFRGEHSLTSLPTYQDDLGMNRQDVPLTWSDDPRSEASQEDYTGKGPKGWKRSDDSIRDEACEALARDWDVDATDIEVKVEDGLITLSGEVTDRGQKKAAEKAVENIHGVHDVLNEIAIKKDIEGWIPGLGEVKS